MPFVIWTQCYFCCILGGLINQLLVFYFRVEEKFAGGKFREIPFAVDIIFAGGKFRAKSKFAKIAKIYSTRKIGVIQYCNLYQIRHILGVTLSTDLKCNIHSNTNVAESYKCLAFVRSNLKYCPEHLGTTSLLI